MVFKAVVTCPFPEYGYLLTAGQQVVWVCTVEACMLVLPLGLLLGLGGFCFRVAGGPVCLILCCTFLCQGVSSHVAQHTTVGRNPLQCDSVTSAEGGKRGRKIVQFRTSV